MKTSPKLLPLLARKAGLSQDKAEALWRDAFADESLTMQGATNPELFFRRVLEHFQQYAAQQNAACASAPSRAAPLQGETLGAGFALA